MMQTLLENHNEILNRDVRFYERDIYRNIDWSQRFIAIKGTRGSGKTICLLQHARQHYMHDRTCLYVDMNDFYFARHSLTAFIDEFYKKGGKVLLLDQINKYPSWSYELNYCYEHYPDLQMIFAGSSLLKFDQPRELSERVAVYELEGLSFREMVNFETGKEYPAYSLQDVLENHEEIALEILKDLRPLAYFSDYLKAGYYPFYFENRHNYTQKLLKFINLILEVDITYINQIEIKYIHKLRKLLYLLAINAPFQPNVSKLSNDVEVSRATIMNYLKYLKDAQLINLLHARNGASMKKPHQVYLQNTNLIYTIAPWNNAAHHMRKTFFYSQMKSRHLVESSQAGDFLIDDNYIFTIGDKDDKTPHKENSFLAADMIELGKERKIPLWLFGFTY